MGDLLLGLLLDGEPSTGKRRGKEGVAPTAGTGPLHIAGFPETAAAWYGNCQGAMGPRMALGIKQPLGATDGS